jgi:hypothetical protein
VTKTHIPIAKPYRINYYRKQLPEYESVPVLGPRIHPPGPPDLQRVVCNIIR